MTMCTYHPTSHTSIKLIGCRCCVEEHGVSADLIRTLPRSEAYIRYTHPTMITRATIVRHDVKPTKQGRRCKTKTHTTHILYLLTLTMLDDIQVHIDSLSSFSVIKFYLHRTVFFKKNHT